MRCARQWTDICWPEKAPAELHHARGSPVANRQLPEKGGGDAPTSSPTAFSMTGTEAR